MTESQRLLTAATALLLLCVASHVPRLAARFGRRAWLMAGLGALLPLLDLPLFYFRAQDRIEFLTLDPLLSAPLPALGAILAWAGAIGLWSGWRAAREQALSLGTGLALHLALAALTPSGVAWLSPLSAGRWAWPLFPSANWPLALLTAALLMVMELWPARTRLLGILGGSALTLYLLLVLGGRFWAAAACAPATDGAGLASRVEIEPTAPWPTPWLLVRSADEGYRAVLAGLNGSCRTVEPIAAWNDQPRLLWLLGDPVAQRVYLRLFRYPVARVSTASSQITLVVQELRDVIAAEPGPTFVLRTDLGGRDLLYQLQRFE
jgi:hypothetical protein